jgi:hypothetical protein
MTHNPWKIYVNDENSYSVYIDHPSEGYWFNSRAEAENFQRALADENIDPMTAYARLQEKAIMRNDECTYVIENDIIISPGKFEGETYDVPNWWEQVIEGNHNEEHQIGNLTWYIFIFTDEDKIDFPAYAEDYGIALCEDDQGFVHSAVLRIANDIYEL